jgi:hypothetical protein
MKAASLIIAVLIVAASCRADSLPPSTERLASSQDGRLIVRLSTQVQVFALDADEKGYSRISEFDTASESTPLKVLISEDGRFVITLDGGRGMGRGRDVVAVYAADGRKLEEWSLAEILTKEDLAAVPSSVSATWWRKEAFLAYPRPTVVVIGPDPNYGATKFRYRYHLDVESLTWTKLQ